MNKILNVGSVMSVDRGYRSSIQFPDPKRATMPEGLIAVGGQPDVGTLYHAYQKGIFPWPQEGYPMLWFFPEERGVLFFKDLRINKSLGRAMRKVTNGEWSVTFNQAFPQVIEACQQQPRPDQDGTWITDELKAAYLAFFSAGFVQSCEVWEDGELIGGMYAVQIDNRVAAESMFYKKSDASKVAVVSMIENLKNQGVTWMDIQMVTPVTEALGGKYISRREFIELFEG